jgi:hypothetical protein
MAQNKTTETNLSVTEYLQQISDEKRRTDCAEMIELFKTSTGLEPKMWGTSIVGFGSYHYIYESGRQGDAPLVGLSSRANAISLYLSSEFEGKSELLQQLGKHKSGKGCIYLQKIEDINPIVLSKLILHSIAYIQKKYPKQ